MTSKPYLSSFVVLFLFISGCTDNNGRTDATSRQDANEMDMTQADMLDPDTVSPPCDPPTTNECPEIGHCFHSTHLTADGSGYAFGCWTDSKATLFGLEGSKGLGLVRQSDGRISGKYLLFETKDYGGYPVKSVKKRYDSSKVTIRDRDGNVVEEGFGGSVDGYRGTFCGHFASDSEVLYIEGSYQIPDVSTNCAF